MDVASLLPLPSVTEAQNAGNRTANRWLDNQIKRGRNEVFTVSAELTPTIAKALLDRNPSNRLLNEVTVENYARDIANGAWRLNGQTLVVASDGHMNDGQHRCNAVIAAGMPIRVVFVFGVERDSRFTLDQGRVRSAADFLGMNGHHDTKALAAAAAMLWQYRQRAALSGQAIYRPTKGEVLGTIERTPSLARSVGRIDGKGSSTAGGRSLLGFCHCVFSEASSVDAASLFIDALMEGANLSGRDPILYVRNRLIQERGRLRGNERAELIFRGWNAHRRGETPKTLPILGSLPTVER